jgi:hypothetical protein
MRAALSSNSQESGTLPQDAYPRGSYRGADDGQCEEALDAKIADVVNRRTLARPQASQRSFEHCPTSIDGIAGGQGFVWCHQAFVDGEDDLSGRNRLLTQVWLEKAKRERRRARARRAWSWILILAIGVGALAVLGTQDSLKALQFIGIDVAQLLSTTPL